MLEKGVTVPPKQTILDALVAALGIDNIQTANNTQAWAHWARWFSLLSAAVPKVQTFSLAINPGVCAANTTTALTFSCPGLKTTDRVHVNKPSHTAGLVIGNAFVPSDDNLTIVFGNLTGAGIDPPLETYRIDATRG